MIDLRKPSKDAWQKSEDSLQIKCAEFTKKELLRRNLPQLFHHCPNGGNRSQREAAKLKLMGVLPGVPDIFIPFRAGEYSGLYVELKDHKGRPSAHQVGFMEDAAKEGFLCVVINCLDVYKETVTEYLNQRNEQQ